MTTETLNDTVSTFPDAVVQPTRHERPLAVSSIGWAEVHPDLPSAVRWLRAVDLPRAVTRCEVGGPLTVAVPGVARASYVYRCQPGCGCS